MALKPHYLTTTVKKFILKKFIPFERRPSRPRRPRPNAALHDLTISTESRPNNGTTSPESEINAPLHDSRPNAVRTTERSRRNLKSAYQVIAVSIWKEFEPTKSNLSLRICGSILMAAALILVSGAMAIKLGLNVIARIKGYADAAQAPELFTTAPAIAIPKAIVNAGLKASDIDFYEINEAFSVVALANQRLLNIDPKRLNAHGGAVSLGHPLGCSTETQQWEVWYCWDKQWWRRCIFLFLSSSTIGVWGGWHRQCMRSLGSCCTVNSKLSIQ
ncbi:acetyl-CoA acetyltransferase [Striga asiatica]|uniref:Acetyl-CoA acetyltransferase n=1 Tax=Striga asiatica TaxID=4170 RepID=A0A5A7PTP8_STRAF|nr:acetyl-CoA acetyltransferase [Striga asiatica]